MGVDLPKILGFDWAHVCGKGETTPCVQPEQAAYLGALLLGVLIFAVAAYRARALPTATLSLMPVAIAINVTMGSIVAWLHLPIYLDSIGTVLTGALCGPWAGALTGLLADLIWSILPIPGGASPTIAFFAPVGGVIGLMAGFWGRRGVFRLRPDDVRVGSFIALAAGVAAAALAFLAIQQSGYLPNLGSGSTQDDQDRFVIMSVALVVFGAAIAWLSRRTVFAFRAGPKHLTWILVAATGLSAGVLVFALLRLLFAPTGYFSTVDGKQDYFHGLNLTGLAMPDNNGLLVVLAIALLFGLAAAFWASHGEHARLFPVWIGGLTTGLVAAAMSAPIAAGVFGGVTGAGTDALVALFRTLGMNVFTSAFAQGLTSDPLDKTISYTVVFMILAALPVSVRTMFSHGEDTVGEDTVAE